VKKAKSKEKMEKGKLSILLLTFLLKPYRFMWQPTIFSLTESLQMKIYVLCTLIILVLANHCLAEEMPWETKLPFASGTIRYVIDGMEKGSDTLYIKDYGRLTAKHHTGLVEMMGRKIQSKSLEISDLDWIHTYDFIEGTGVKRTNPIKFMRQAYEQLTDVEKQQVRTNSRKLAINLTQGGGGQREEKVGEMFGFPVDRTTMMGLTSYTIHRTSLMLQSSGTLMGMRIDLKATSLEQGTVDAANFAHPQGIEAVFSQQADDMAMMMAQTTMAWLKDPEAAKESSPKLMPGAMLKEGSQPPSQENKEGAGSAGQALLEGLLQGMSGN
jgi:hypothetical protein